MTVWVQASMIVCRTASSALVDELRARWTWGRAAMTTRPLDRRIVGEVEYPLVTVAPQSGLVAVSPFPLDIRNGLPAADALEELRPAWRTGDVFATTHPRTNCVPPSPRPVGLPA
jgi:hypothetical protein